MHSVSFSYITWYYASFYFTKEEEEDMNQFHKEDTELLYNRPGWENKLGLSKNAEAQGTFIIYCVTTKRSVIIFALHFLFAQRIIKGIAYMTQPLK